MSSERTTTVMAGGQAPKNLHVRFAGRSPWGFAPIFFGASYPADARGRAPRRSLAGKRRRAKRSARRSTPRVKLGDEDAPSPLPLFLSLQRCSWIDTFKYPR